MFTAFGFAKIEGLPYNFRYSIKHEKKLPVVLRQRRSLGDVTNAILLKHKF
jgi:hypothetical protein